MSTTWNCVPKISVGVLACDTFFKACPSLQRFTFKTSFRENPSRDVWNNHHPHRCLQVVELIGFNGSAAEAEFVKYLVQSAGKLDKIVINPCCPWLVGSPGEMSFTATEHCKKARECALELEAAFPLWEFVVL